MEMRSSPAAGSGYDQEEMRTRKEEQETTLKRRRRKLRMAVRKRLKK